jgi:hypothetical protein
MLSLVTKILKKTYFYHIEKIGYILLKTYANKFNHFLISPIYSILLSIVIIISTIKSFLFAWQSKLTLC